MGAYPCHASDLKLFPWRSGGDSLGTPVHSHLIRAYCMPSTGLDAGVTIINKVSSLLPVKLKTWWREAGCMSCVINSVPGNRGGTFLHFCVTALSRVAGAALPPPQIVRAGTGSEISVTGPRRGERDRPPTLPRQGCSLHCQTSSVSFLPPLVIPAALSAPLPLTSFAKGSGLDYSHWS